MIRKFVLDTTAFVTAAALPQGQLIYPTQVSDELLSQESRLRAELSRAKPVVVKGNFLAKAREAQQRTGDRVSPTDLAVIACAIQEHATVVSDDYGVQNIARELGVDYLSLGKRGITEKWVYEYKCVGCGKTYLKTGACADCGGKIVRKRV